MSLEVHIYFLRVDPHWEGLGGGGIWQSCFHWKPYFSSGLMRKPPVKHKKTVHTQAGACTCTVNLVRTWKIHCLHRRRKRGGRGGGGEAPPIIWEGAQHTLCRPNNPPTFSFNFYVKQEKKHKCTKLKGKIIINATLIWFEGTGKIIPLNPILEFSIISDFKMRNVIIWHWFY